MKIVSNIMSEVRQLRNSSILVFNTNFTQIGKMNLFLLKGFLDIEHLTGYFIALDRPHQYMSYLLHMHNVSQENLWFVDAVTYHSGTKQEAGDNVEFVEGPFHIETLFDTFELIDQGKGASYIAMDRVDFIIVDNISTMLNYNELDQVEKFIVSFNEFIGKRPHITGGITVDPDPNPELKDLLLNHNGHSIDLEKLKKDVEK
ncbi:MAG: hypothetical protein R6U17_09750 [Thermoplasmata archaeon]